MEAGKTGSRQGLRTLCETMTANAEDVAAEVVRHWGEIGQAEPWHALPDDLDLDHLPDLIRALALAALCTEFDRDRCAKVVAISAEHGEYRAEQGFDESLIYREYHLLRRALWTHLKADHGETATVFYATMRIDALISLANSASLHGLNRDQLEPDGRWPDALEELLESWPLPIT